MRTTLMLSAAALLVGSNASAQDKPPSPKEDESCKTFPDGRKECVRMRVRGPGDSLLTSYFFDHDSALMKRAALGVELRPTGTRRDTLGVFIAAVTPRGPAENAGIVEGDRIAAINGVDVRSVAADVDDPYTNGLASHRLRKEVEKLTPGARVTLRVYSAGRFRAVVVTAGRASDVLRHAGGFRLRFPGRGGMEFGAPGAMMFSPDVRMRIERMMPELEKRLKSLKRSDFPRIDPERVKMLQSRLDDVLADLNRERRDPDEMRKDFHLRMIEPDRRWIL